MRMYGLDLTWGKDVERDFYNYNLQSFYNLRIKSQRLEKWREITKMTQSVSGLADAYRTRDLPYFENEIVTSDFICRG